jgi:hypothetical protein
VGSPPATPAPATPFNVADVPVTFVASFVIAVGGTFVQYGFGGLTPGGHTIVAPAGMADSATTAAAMSPARGPSRLRCAYLVM